jgi:outer membrane phospholipase A
MNYLVLLVLALNVFIEVTPVKADDLDVPQLVEPQLLNSNSASGSPPIDRVQANPNLAIPDEDESHLLSLYSYKPIFFLSGNPYTKIQLSFETQIIKDFPVYFGYSQLMIWNLFIPSPFFYDLNYNPLAWYRVALDSDRTEWVDIIPEEHESNGRGGSGEYSWNRMALAYHRTDPVGDDMKLYSDFKIWYPWQYNVNNSDLAQYRGIWELNMTLSGFLGPIFAFSDVALRLYPGGASFTDPTAGGQELTLRLRGRKRKFLPLATFQIFHGYGEYLQDYQWSHWGIRAGLGF